MRVLAVIFLLALLFLSVVTVSANDIVLIPSEPTSGANLIFYIVGLDGSAIGYVVCENNNVHLIEMYNGLGQVSLDENDFGDATVKIFVGNVTYSKTFYIKPFFEGSLVIETPASVLINTEMAIKIFIGSVPADGAAVKFTSLTGRTFSRVAGTDGTITTSFDEKGPWEIEAEIYGVTTSTTVKVMLPPLDIVFSENIEVDEEMKIAVGKPADITIKKEEITWTYRTDANGDLFFTPPWPGKYTVDVRTEDQEGTKTFITISETRIDVYDYEMSVPVSRIKKDMFVEIVVVDLSGVPISEISEILVYCDNSLWNTFSLSDGSVVWLVDHEATTYRFEVEEKEGYKSSTTTVYGFVERSLIPKDIIFYIILIIIILIVLIVFFRFYRSGRLQGIRLPRPFSKGLKEKLSGITSRGKKLE